MGLGERASMDDFRRPCSGVLGEALPPPSLSASRGGEASEGRRERLGSCSWGRAMVTDLRLLGEEELEALEAGVSGVLGRLGSLECGERAGEGRPPPREGSSSCGGGLTEAREIMSGGGTACGVCEGEDESVVEGRRNGVIGQGEEECVQAPGRGSKWWHARTHLRLRCFGLRRLGVGCPWGGVGGRLGGEQPGQEVG